MSKPRNWDAKPALIPYPKLNRTIHVDISADDSRRERSDCEGPVHSPRAVPPALSGQHSRSHQLHAANFRISQKEIQEAFDFFDVFGRKRLSAKDLKMRMNTFYPNLDAREYKFLMGGEGSLTIDSLFEIMESNTLQNFDPLLEAFKVFDPNGTGFIDEGTLRRIMRQTGHGEIDDEDMQVLLSVADVDRDGRISLEDFANMITRSDDDPGHDSSGDDDSENGNEHDSSSDNDSTSTRRSNARWEEGA